MSSAKISKFSIDYLIGTKNEENSSNNNNNFNKIQKLKFSTNQEEKLHPALRNIKINLENEELWSKFHSLDTEMIVTKSGRRMFPTLQISISGLDPLRKYSLMVDFVCIDKKRYRYSFHQSKWVIAGIGEAGLPGRVHIHADSPALGSRWIKQSISFDKIKLTNNQMDQNGHIIVNSMHRYQPRFHVILCNNNTSIYRSDLKYSKNDSDSIKSPKRIFLFPETSFMAVTAYQNHRITELKIESNPFAKGFRECELGQVQNLTFIAQQQQQHYFQQQRTLFFQQQQVFYKKIPFLNV